MSLICFSSYSVWISLILRAYSWGIQTVWLTSFDFWYKGPRILYNYFTSDPFCPCLSLRLCLFLVCVFVLLFAPSCAGSLIFSFPIQTLLFLLSLLSCASPSLFIYLARRLSQHLHQWKIKASTETEIKWKCLRCGNSCSRRCNHTL